MTSTTPQPAGKVNGSGQKPTAAAEHRRTKAPAGDKRETTKGSPDGQQIRKGENKP